MTDREIEARALLVRAAHVEAKRQDARHRGDMAAENGHHAELQRIWRRFATLESGAVARGAGPREQPANP